MKNKPPEKDEFHPGIVRMLLPTDESIDSVKDFNFLPEAIIREVKVVNAEPSEVTIAIIAKKNDPLVLIE